MKKSILFLVLTSILSFNIKAQTSELWGMTTEGGAYNAGVIFKTDANGDNQQIVYNWFKYEGGEPNGSPMQASNGKLYGMTERWGIHHAGVLFEYDPITNTYIKKIDFGGVNGSHPKGSLIQASNGKLYGITRDGGVNGKGVLFEYDPATNTFTKKFDFDQTNGAYPMGSLMQASNGKIYGMTVSGGSNDNGVLFEYDLTANTYTKKFDFNGTNGTNPNGSLIQATNGKLYGLTEFGGSNSYGVLFEYNPTTDAYTKKIDFDGANGARPFGSLMQAFNGKLYGITTDGGTNGKGVLFEYIPTNNTYIKKFDFNQSNGSHPKGSLVQASNGKLYGMTFYGDSNNMGGIFEYDPATNIYVKKIDFVGANNGIRYGGMKMATNGIIYGMKNQGGILNLGVLFKYNPTTNTYMEKIDFGKSENGEYPSGSLIQYSNGKFYGMTIKGGINDDGVLFEYNPSTNTYIKKLDFNGINGSKPDSSLMQASNGKLYGITKEGGINDFGVLFEYDPVSNIYTKKFDFDGINGSKPNGSLIQASNGNLYGLTESGGTNNKGVLFEYNPSTDIFIKQFDFDDTNGAGSFGSLMQATNGKLYGMTGSGGAYGPGVLFEFDPVINNFNKKIDFDGTNGMIPVGSLIQTSNGKLYGLTFFGGTNQAGVLFEYDFTTNTYIKKFDFDVINGSNPNGYIMQAANGKLYGMTIHGGTNNEGVLFKYDLATDTFTKKMDFDGINGKSPTGSLIEVNASLSIENQADLYIKISPNPTTNLIKIIMPEKPVKVSIVNMAGVLIYETDQTGKEMSIDMSNYANAVYLVKIQTDNGVATYKVIKQ